MDEADIIQRIIRGERTLYRVLIERYKDISLTVALSILRNRDDAEDVVQDALVKAYQGLSTFRLNSSFGTWLYRIVVNTSHKSLQKKKIRRTLSLEERDVKSTTTRQTGFDLTHENERKRVIQKALSVMKPNESLVLKLHYLGEQSLNEIVEITGMGLSNVKVTLHRARASFNKQLEILIGKEATELL